MCTVSIFYKGNKDFVLTSNRDEAPNRNALSPAFYILDNTELLMPKDEQSGGSWIGASDENRIVCLLNGGFKGHKRKPKYRQSRGVVVTDLLTTEDIEATIASYNFEDIEPFTIVIADWNTDLKFYELVWDEKQKHFQQLPLEAKIWSSSTLYSEDKKEARRDWFEDFISNNEWSSKALLDFHKTAGSGNNDYGVVMDRGFVKTTSITQIEKTDALIEMQFYNLNTSEKTSKIINLAETIDE
ncbi:NRDE family protein [Lacinutrix jangbogonensis]|uniref:NRDE family protein n=1 Tax=Lacinutrix jangbogonensis TaxID=1469557 RepID=UPI00053E2E4B|nr:NRDE family protein [Lacinutrix jangbogonensis]